MASAKKVVTSKGNNKVKPKVKPAAKKAAKAAKVAASPKIKKSKKKKSPAVIHIKLEYCKGCGICIEFCPTQVLGFEGGKVKVVNLEACIKCMFCELRCPDFAIAVEES